MTRKKTAPGSWVALLRGINVGGKHKLPMKDLAAIFVEAGAADVRTFIQSGNVLFRAPAPADAINIQESVAAAIPERFGFAAPVVLRSSVELQAAMDSNPFLHAGEAEEYQHVMFLSDRADPERAATLDPNRFLPDQFKLVGREIYLHLPNGPGQSKLTNAYFDTRLKVVSTSRNWRTVRTLCELSA